ncbi:hypothetical protein FSP39_010958 [Pinctada imbricata]|uniref:Uncharacterized protein n=1 Tax=Pinctada imbricata TaxID=66713 RepID=A0AA88XU63_PINIB|nr:hypothetical protein FSP39_010958 [Pinctada imbricata]
MERLCRCWICLPFTAGHRVSDLDPRKLDGRISTMVALACLVAPSIVIMLVSMSHSEVHKYSETLIRLALALFTFLGLSSVLLFFLPYTKKRKWQRKFTADITLQTNLMNNIRILFMLFFALGFSAQHLFLLAYDGLKADSVPLDVLHKVIALVFCISQSVFLCVHKRRVFSIKSELCIRYGMIMIIAADVSIWFHTILNESQELFKHSLVNTSCSSEKHMGNQSKTLNETTDDTQHINEICALAKMIEKTNLILSPMVIEYCLLSIGLLLRLWSNTVAKEKLTNEDSLPDNNKNKLRSAGFDSFGPQADLCMESKVKSLIESNVKGQEEKQQSVPFPYFHLWLFFAIFLLVFKYIATTIDTKQMYLTYEAFQSVYVWALLISTIWAFYIISHKYEVSPNAKALKVREYLLVFCCFGTIFYLTFTVIVGAVSVSHKSGVVIMIEFIVDCLSVYFQTTLMILSGRLVPKRGMNSFSLNNLFVVISSVNLAFWIIDGFVTSSIPSTSRIQSDFYGKEYWFFIAKVVFPFTVYYRFHSFIEFMDLSMKA